MTRRAAVSSLHRRLAEGSLWVVCADALVLPTGLLTAGFLSRHLGVEHYGSFTLAASLIAWVQWTISAGLGTATISAVSRTETWEAVAATAGRSQLIIGTIAGLVLLGLATPLATLLEAPALATPLRLFALDIPLVPVHGFGTGRAVQAILLESPSGQKRGSHCRTARPDCSASGAIGGTGGAHCGVGIGAGQGAQEVGHLVQATVE